MISSKTWKSILVVVAILLGAIYTLPNFYGTTLAVQISNNTETVDMLPTMLSIESSFKTHNIKFDGEYLDSTTHVITFKFPDSNNQLNARSLLTSTLGSGYTVALDLVSNSPHFLRILNANPMFLGLDLRGGVHFLLSVDLNAAINKILMQDLRDIKHTLQDNGIRYGDNSIVGNSLTLNMRDVATASNAYTIIKSNLPHIKIINDGSNLIVSLSQEDIAQIKENALSQNMFILHNRVNELGVNEPTIQKQGDSRIVVELPGIEDIARAKAILGRTATLELHMVDNDSSDLVTNSKHEIIGVNSSNVEVLPTIGDPDNKVPVYKDVELTGDNIVDARSGFDENNAPAVDIRLDSAGSSVFKDLTSNNIGKRMAMVLIDNNVAQVITAPVIRSAIGGGNVQISGSMNVDQANDISLLLRSGSLAAPMQIIEERSIGPSLGAQNIASGLHSVLWGFLALAIFIIIYYRTFGAIAVTCLAVNLLLLVALLSMLQATLTLPGMAAIALALGIAIDSNVLINERIREELRLHKKPFTAIEEGYKHAFATIIDSNITTLIAGLALLAFGSGSIRGFAVVHCLGIVTSLFSAVLVSKTIVALIYCKKHTKKISIG